MPGPPTRRGDIFFWTTGIQAVIIPIDIDAWNQICPPLLLVGGGDTKGGRPWAGETADTAAIGAAGPFTIS